MKKNIVWICCGVLEAELKELKRTNLIEGELVFLNSMLHMCPPTLENLLKEKLKTPNNPNTTIVLVYGDCSAGMSNLSENYRINRINAINCAQMLVGKNHYKELMKQEAFILLPEWASRWKEIITQELGLNEKVAKDFMRETRKKIVFLDTGLVPVPTQELAKLSLYTGLPCQIEQTELTHLLSYMKDALASANGNHV